MYKLTFMVELLLVKTKLTFTGMLAHSLIQCTMFRRILYYEINYFVVPCYVCKALYSSHFTFVRWFQALWCVYVFIL